jgi:hypothetical protein
MSGCYGMPPHYRNNGIYPGNPSCIKIPKPCFRMKEGFTILGGWMFVFKSVRKEVNDVYSCAKEEDKSR